MGFVVRSNDAWLTVLIAGTDVLQLGGDGRIQATYDCSIIEIYRLEPCDSHIVFLYNDFIYMMDMSNI